MVQLSRRNFLVQGSTAIAAGCFILGPGSLPLNPPIGLQLYTVGDQLAKDFEGTLQQIAAIGYKEVEMAGFFGKKPDEIKAALSNVGLHCGSAHIFGQQTLEQTLDFVKELGAKYIITSSRAPKRISDAAKEPKTLGAMNKELTLDDYRSLADVYNKMGEQAKRVGLQLAYHNHTREFQSFNGVIANDELLRLTDPELVYPATYLAELRSGQEAQRSAVSASH